MTATSHQIDVIALQTLVPLLLGSQWTGSVWFMQIYCLVYALLPIHTTNLQALNGMGRSDLFLRLEIVKKAYGALWIALAAFLFGDIRLMVAGYLVTGLLSTVVNAWPNRRVIGYSYAQQIRDVAPALLLTLAASAAGWAVSLLQISGISLLLAQAAAFACVYLGSAFAFRVEELSYIIAVIRSFVGK